MTKILRQEVMPQAARFGLIVKKLNPNKTKS